MKHAFVDRKTGRLSVGFRRIGEELELLIKDDGRGIRAELGEGKNSFGNLLIRTFTEQLEGSLEIDGSAGTTVRLRFPVEPV